MGGTRFMVQWEEHPSHLATRLGQLLEHQTLVDVTLMCNTHTLRVHRAVLAACSPYFETILQRQLGMYPLIVLKDMQFSVLKSLIEFMYCGETSVTEDNLSALLQAAKFFQVKGLSAMTREALGLTPTAPSRTTPANSTVNGETTRKGFVGRSKRVGVQQTLVSSGLKTVTTAAHVGATTAAAASQLQGVAEPQPAQTVKTVFQTAPKSVQIRTESQQQQQQQQTDTAQLLLSLSGSEFPKQTFHTVSKNVRFHHNVSTPGAVTVEPSRTCPIESTVIKNKDTISKSEMIDRVPVITPNGGVKSATVVLPNTISEKIIEPTSGAETAIESVKDEVTSQQVFYMDDTIRKRGRPLKRQMNIMFKEKVLTDAEMALQKEAEASRKALEMLQQEMSTGDELAVSAEELQPQKHATAPLGVSKLQTAPLNSTVASSQRLVKETAVTTKAAPVKAEVTQVSTVSTSQSAAQNVIYQVAGSTVPGIDSNNETNIVYQLEGGNLLSQDGSGNIVYQVADNAVMAGQDANGQNIIYQVADSTVPSGEGNSNANVIYQVADGNNTPLMTQYMEALKEAGLPSDVPILLESGDGSYVSVNEEILMNIMNGGMIQVADGSLVGGENVQFIVQEVQELPEGQEAVAETAAEQQAGAEMEVSATNAGETVSSVEPMEPEIQHMEPEIQHMEPEIQHMEPGIQPVEPEIQPVDVADTKALDSESSELKVDLPQSVSSDEMLINQTMEEEAILPTLEPEEREMSEAKAEVMQISQDSGHAKQLEVEGSHSVDVSAAENTVHPAEAPTHSDEIITGDSYGQEAMEGFAVMESNVSKEADTSLHYKEDSCDFSKEASTNDFDHESSSEQLEIRIPEKETKVDTNANAGMSVEQALQAMMGESSDTEMEVCTNASEQQDVKVKPVMSQQDTKIHGTNEASTDEETEDLRLVLSPEDESGKSSINDSFTLALSSPDSSGNEKVQSEMEACVESSQESHTDKQSPHEHEEKDNTDGTKELKLEERGTTELELVLSTDYHPTSQQAAESEVAVTEVENVNADMQSSTKEAEIETVDSTAPESEILEADSSMSVEGGTGLVLDQTSIDSGSCDAETTILQKQIELTEDNVNDKATGNIPEETEMPTTCSEIDTSSNVISGDNNVNINEGYSDTIAGKSLPILTDNDAETIPDNEPVISERTDNTEDKDSTWLEPSSTEPELLENDTKQENSENFASTVPVSEDYSLSSTNLVHSDSSVPKLESLQIERQEDTESGDKALEELPETNTSSSEPCDTNTVEQQDGSLEFVEYELKDKSEAPDIESILAKTVKTDVIGEEASAGEELELSADQSGIEAKTELRDGSKVASPVKDIPYAVGLLPLKTALEKLQAMPEHHPRKTRSASSSKESSEAPGVRLKRKASSSSEGVEKKQKTSDGDEADTSSDTGIMLSTTEESDELVDANTSLESVPEDEVSNLITMSEEPLQTEKNKEDILPSVMDLVNEPNDSL